MSEASASPSQVSASERISWSNIVAYGAPGVGVGYMYLLINLFVMKFSTDVLLIAPAVMGTIFGISRVWDAISDPLVGYLSDKTTHSMGRRRLWLSISALPIALVFIMVFSPPADLRWLVDRLDGSGCNWFLLCHDRVCSAPHVSGCGTDTQLP